MLTEFTPEQEAQLEATFQEYLKKITEQYTLEQVEEAVALLWKEVFNTNKQKVILCDSPNECKRRSKEEHPGENLKEFWSYWCFGYSAMYEFALKIGLDLDKEKVNIFSKWATMCPFVIMNRDIVYVSKNPIKTCFEGERLHNENGKCIEFADGFGIYAINGVLVTEQIVMHPETITLRQIDDEENEEVKRIMIERYGNGRYLEDIGAEIIDGPHDNFIEGTKEYLFRTVNNEVYLLCVCPSTTKEFYLEVPPETTDCVSAQSWLSGGMSNRIISAS